MAGPSAALSASKIFHPSHASVAEVSGNGASPSRDLLDVPLNNPVLIRVYLGEGEAGDIVGLAARMSSDI